jgi:hypothetical protein
MGLPEPILKQREGYLKVTAKHGIERWDAHKAAIREVVAEMP